MNDSSSSSPPRAAWLDRLLPAATLGLVVVLSGMLVVSRRDAASLRAEAAQRTEDATSVIAGRPLPALKLIGADGAPATLAEYCSADAPTLVVFSLAGCASCEALQPDWIKLARSRPEVRVVVVEADRASGAGDVAPVVYAVASSDSITAHFGVQKAPATVAVSPGCQVAAAGAGEAASRSILRLVASHAPAR